MRWANLRVWLICVCLSLAFLLPGAVENVFPHVAYQLLQDYIAEGLRSYSHAEVNEHALHLLWSLHQATECMGILMGSMLVPCLSKHGRVGMGVIALGMLMVPARLLAIVAATFLRAWPLLFLARLLSFTANAVLISEIAPPDIRGRLGCIQPLVSELGYLFATFIASEKMLGQEGRWWSVYVLSLGLILPAVLFLVALPESPTFLLASGNVKDTGFQAVARRSLVFYQNSDAALDECRRDAAMLKQKDQSQGLSSWWELCRSRKLRTPLVLSLAVGLFYAPYLEFTIYSTLILVHAGFSNYDAQRAVFLIGVVTMCTTMLAMAISDRMGRRRQLLSMGTVSTAAFATFGLLFILRDPLSLFPDAVEALRWLTLGCGLVFTLGMSLGIRALWYIIVPEMFPYRYRAPAKALANSAVALHNTLSVFAFYQLLEVLGGWSFVLMSVPQVLALLYSYRRFHETGHRTLADIADDFGLGKESAPLLAS